MKKTTREDIEKEMKEIKNLPIQEQRVHWSLELEDWKKNKPDPSIFNFQLLLFAYNINIKFNQMTKRLEIEDPDNRLGLPIIGIYEEQQRAFLNELCRTYKLPVTSVQDWVFLSAQPYHPFKDWIMQLHRKWDGKNRLDELFKTLNVKKDKELASEYFRIWCLQTARNLLTDRGYVNEYVLVLKGEQGAGKTKWIRKLAKDDFVKTGLQLNPNNKDSVLEANSVTICELGELDATTRKADHAQLKAFLSKDYDYVRRPYGREEVKMPRKTSFIASVNNETFLVDDTGNRRYLVVEVGNINYQHNIDMQSFWYEMYHVARRTDSKIYLDGEFRKLQEQQAEKFRTMHPIEEAIHHGVDTLYKESYSIKELIEVLTGIDRPSQNDCKVAKQTMLSLGWDVKQKGGRAYQLINPNLKSETDASHPF